MQLEELLQGVPVNTPGARPSAAPIHAICTDSRKVVQGDVYVALKGARFNGNDFISAAVRQGAVAVITDEDVPEEYGTARIIKVEDARAALYRITRSFYGDPSRKVNTVGITGTNGKTTITYLIESILAANGDRCGVMGTVNCRKGAQIIESSQTTPDYIDNQKFLADLALDNIPYCVMEVSSHALAQDRVLGISFCAGIFTNLTSDHLDYHETREEYFNAKSRLITGLDPQACAIINVDDEYGRKLPPMSTAGVMTYGIKNDADLTARDIELSVQGSRFDVVYNGGGISLETRLFGIFNVYNILAAVAFALSRGIKGDVIKKGVADLQCVPGRLERIDGTGNYSVFIDYAHTEDALRNVLTAIRRVCDARILLVFGCGGDRDKSKRKLMGRVACEMADHSFVTSDNPRTEDPQAIIDQIEQGFDRDNYTIIPDRREAIRQALAEAGNRDVVLLAGKGHEAYQILGDRKVGFIERDIVREFLSNDR